MSWPKELEESYAYQQKIRDYMIDCVMCGFPITPTEQKNNKGMCNFCVEEKKYERCGKKSP